MAFIKWLVVLFLTLSTITNAAGKNIDDEWDIPCMDDECTPKTSKARKEAKRFVDFSSFTYNKVVREIKARHPKFGIFIGPYFSQAGQAQTVPIVGVIGDYLSVTSKSSTRGIIGGTVYLDSLEFELDNFALKYAFSSFYLSPRSVDGQVTQEELVTNLDYSYQLTNVASFVGVRLINLLNGKRCNLTVDAGIGTNQVTTGLFLELPRAEYAIPDNAFRGTTTLQFAYMLGAGFQIQNAFGKHTLGCGYSFLSLGTGKLATINTQIPNELTTGKNYANAIMCSIQLG